MGSLKITLSIDGGPKKGETLDVYPGKLMRIGRVVRGNTVAIKDPSISEKHLTVEFLPEICQWAVTDLDSSNGTIVNGVAISPNAPAPLADGDIIKIGQCTFMSVKISAVPSAPEHRIRRGRRITAAAAVQKEWVEENMGDCSARHSEDQLEVEKNPEEPAKNGGKGRALRKKGSASAGCSKSDQSFDFVMMEENGRRKTRARATSVRGLKDRDEVKADEPTKRGKGNTHSKSGFWPAGISRKEEFLAPVGTKVVDEELEIEEKTKDMAKDGVKGRVRAKRNLGSARVSWKGEVLEPLMVQCRQRRVTRASKIVMDKSTLVSKEFEEEVDKENKVEAAKNGRNLREKGKRDVQLSVISRKYEAVKPRACSGILFKGLHSNQVKDKLKMNSEGLKMAWKKKLTVEHNLGCEGHNLAVEVENDVDNILASENSSGEEKCFPKSYSWSSFSNVRGIPNTTSKYREDKLINFHATPFEVRVERALKRGTDCASVQI
ncbi:FHA domain-containing protein [Apostasia shenzhenica]|uniref:FHA domain-containing protein n=1 Tax=Apostasia shenzhenica TaxID=1088818 RepID=A0A2H9ZZH9_9ASPA|nr:FHA domain-containing protein [Apostasia shenzhenica]